MNTERILKLHGQGAISLHIDRCHDPEIIVRSNEAGVRQKRSPSNFQFFFEGISLGIIYTK